MEARLRSMVGRLPGWLRRLVEIGASPSDSDELRVRKAVLILSSTLMASLASVWVVTYAALGLWLSAAIPLAYQVASAASIYTFARTKRYLVFRRSQLFMSLLLPFALQWSLGGLPLGDHVTARGVAVRGSASGPPLVRCLRRAHRGHRRNRSRALQRCVGCAPGRRGHVLRAQHPRRGDDRLRAAPVLRAGAGASTRGVRAPPPQRPARVGCGE